MKKKDLQLSLELQILIESIRVVLLNKSKETLTDLIKKTSVDWNKLNKMTIYHRIRPVVYEAFRQVNFNNNFTENLGLFAKRQSIKNLVDSQEVLYILKFLNQHNIPALPYKGQVFLECLYQNKSLRESCDIDIIVQPQNAIKALKLLLADGYQLSVGGEPTDDLLERMYHFYGREVGLDKKTMGSKNVHIDFHWGINESFHEYPIGVDDFFGEAQQSDFHKTQLLLPSTNGIFKMLLNHHGGRGCWLKLKDICDFIAFRNVYSQFSTEKMLEIAQKMEMVNTLKQGINLSDTFFSDTLIKEVSESQKKAKAIFAFWDKAEHYIYDNLRARLAYEKIYRSLQDKNWSWYKSIRSNINLLSIPNPMESKRLMVFPDRFIFLNLFVKLLSGILRRVKKSYFAIIEQ